MSAHYELRDYQKEVVDFYEADSSSFLVHLPTGSGKSVIMKAIVDRACQKGHKVLILIRGKSLIHQFSEHLEALSVEHGIIQANDPDLGKSVQVASIDTFSRRRSLQFHADLILIDEAHFAVSPIWFEVLKKFELCRKISFTATPYRKEGLAHLATKIVRPTTYSSLVKMSFLAPPKYFAPTDINLNKVRVSKGEYVERDLLRIFNNREIYGNVIETYKKHLTGAPAICFAINIVHSQKLAKNFNEHGIKAMHVDQDTPLAERKALICALRAREIDIICNVGVLTTGVDIPEVLGIFLVRPTLSRVLYLQMVGRGSRISPGKDHFKVVDLGGNVFRHGFIEDAPSALLEGGKEMETKIPQFKCAGCGFVTKKRMKNCLHCGFVTKVVLQQLPSPEQTNTDIKIAEVDPDQYLLFAIKEIAHKGFTRGFKEGWVYYEVKKRFGDNAAEKYFPFRHRNRVYEIYVHGAAAS